MIKYGKIIDYNGSSGTIIDEVGKKYILISYNLQYKEAKVNDYVSFKIETYKTFEIEEKIATFVCLVK